MKVKLNCNLKSKSKVWRKGTVFEQPFPPEIASEFKACQTGRVNTLDIIEEDATILFRKFLKPSLEIYQPEKINETYMSPPWFFNQPGAKQKRSLLLRKF